VLYTGGIATLVLAMLSWMVDIKKWKKPLWVFEVFGTNSVLLFVLSGLWAKTILRISFNLDGDTISGYSYLYRSLFVPFAGELNGSLLFALTHVLGFWIILYWLYRKKISIHL
jgi:predicted acyltransferase